MFASKKKPSVNVVYFIFLFKGLWAHPPAPTVCDEGDPPQHPR